MPLDEIRKVKNQYKKELMAIPNVIGVGTGYKNAKGLATDKACLVTLVRQKLPKSALSSSDLVPSEINGIKTDVIEVGNIQLQQTRSDRYRPAPGGVSLGHYQITAGTFGCVVKDNQSGTRMILSNNHVLANHNLAHIGDPILQPAPANNGVVKNDTLAYLTRFVTIKLGLEKSPETFLQTLANFITNLAKLFGSTQVMNVIRNNPSAYNLVDAAVASPVDNNMLSDEILEIGIIQGVMAAELGMPVRKSGKASGLTTGSITTMDLTIDIDFYDGNMARFEDQIMTATMSKGGDSGSLLVHGTQPKAVGLLFAGSDKVSLFNPIQNVLDALEVHF